MYVCEADDGAHSKMPQFAPSSSKASWAVKMFVFLAAFVLKVKKVEPSSVSLLYDLNHWQTPSGRQLISYVLHLCNEGWGFMHCLQKVQKVFLSNYMLYQLEKQFVQLVRQSSPHLWRSVLLWRLIPKISVVSNRHADTNTEDVHYYNRLFAEIKQK